MANHKSALKRHRQSEKRRIRNHAIKTRVRNLVRAVRSEAALSLDDVLSRRTRLAQELADRGASIAPRVAELLGAELGWSEVDRAVAISGYLASAHREYDVPGPSTPAPQS